MSTCIQPIDMKGLIICPMCSYNLFNTSFDEQRLAGQSNVCVCLSAFQGALCAAIRGKQEAHHCGGRKTPAVGDWWKGGWRDSSGWWVKC